MLAKYIEFVGGPYDGLFYDADQDEGGLSSRVVIPVDAALLSSITGEDGITPVRPRSVVVYRVRFSDGRAQFRCAGFQTMTPQSRWSGFRRAFAAVVHWLSHCGMG